MPARVAIAAPVTDVDELHRIDVMREARPAEAALDVLGR
jgi:hypothetical protein